MNEKDKENIIETRINTIIALANSEVGYTEGANNDNKYAKYFDDLRPGYKFYNYPKNHVSWCDIFVDYLFHFNFKDIGRRMIYQPMESCGAGCSYSHKYYLMHNATTNIPKRGYQIFFKDKNNKIVHTGIVYKVDNKKVYTIEGNKNNMVKKCSYNLNSTKIHSYGIPNYLIDISDELPAKDEIKTYKVIAKSGLNKRKGPGTNYPKTGVLSYGAIIKVKKFSEWSLLVSGEYVCSKYIKKV